MDIEGLMQFTNETNRKTLRNFITLKAGVGEKYMHRNEKTLVLITDELFEFIETSKGNLAVNNHNMALLDEFFLKTLNANSNN